MFSPTEELIMLKIWSAEGSTIKQLAVLCDRTKENISTYCQLMEQKGFIKVEFFRSRRIIYSIVSKEDYLKNRLADLMSKFEMDKSRLIYQINYLV